MAKIFIGQRVAEEYGKELIRESREIVDILNKLGHEAYCTLCEDESLDMTPRDWLEHAFKFIDKSDIFLAIIRSENKSEGLLMEIGYVIAKKKKLIVAIKEGIKDTYVPSIAEKVIIFRDIDDLKKKLKEIR